MATRTARGFSAIQYLFERQVTPATYLEDLIFEQQFRSRLDSVIDNAITIPFVPEFGYACKQSARVWSKVGPFRLDATVPVSDPVAVECAPPHVGEAREKATHRSFYAGLLIRICCAA